MSEVVYDARTISSANTTSKVVSSQKSYTAVEHLHNDDQQHYDMGDKAVIQLLHKLEEGAHTIANLRSILTLKTAELNELIAQLELTNQAITNVELTTTQIEAMLKDLGLSVSERESLLIHAEQRLDSAIKSATILYPTSSGMNGLNNGHKRRPSMASNGSSGNANVNIDQDQQRREQRMSARFTTRIRYKPDTKPILRQLNDLLRDLDLDSAKFFEDLGTTDDVQKLQKAKVDLDIAKTIALSAKSNMKRRAILLRSTRRRNAPEEVKILGEKIRESVALWKSYVRGAPLMVDGQDILETLDKEDDLIAKSLPVHPPRMSYDGHASNKGSPTPSTSATARSMRNSLSARSTDRPTHSRSSSTADDPGVSVLPASSAVATEPATVPPVPPIPASVKKMYRHSAAARVPVRGNMVGPRVRTSSLTAQKANAPQKPTASPSTAPVASGRISTLPKSPMAPSMATSGIPSPMYGSSAPPAPSESATAGASETSKKSAHSKLPSQRGPGSTLRIRSMLARRHTTTSNAPTRDL
ncbi:hypothetical protein BX666DRAFT_1978820 [Dichotomocladium elegans]|nr:hypothetical protein BX666DRAFT_1978820 [Dichotomocladium elegans]